MKCFKISEKDLPNPRFFYLQNEIKKCKTREAILNWFTLKDRTTLELPQDVVGESIVGVEVDTPDELESFKKEVCFHVPKKGKEVAKPVSQADDDSYVYGVIFSPDNATQMVLFKLADTANEAPFGMGERFMMAPGALPNYKGTEPLLTDVGKFLLNQLILVDPFNDLIPYKNERFDPEALDREVGFLVSTHKATREMYNKYMDNGYWFADCSIMVPCWSEKSLAENPEILKRKHELIEQYKDSLQDPLVLAKIEKELLEMDKAYIKGDTSEVFYKAGGGGTFTEQRKKLFVLYGMCASFDKNTGSYEFIENSLSDGWNPKDLTVAANEVRRGSYSRGKETAKGGEQSKFILRIFQEVTIDEDDCGTKQGLPVLITPNTAKEFDSRYMMNGEIFYAKDAEKYMGQTIVFRSPMFCKTKPNYCFKCCGARYKETDFRAVGVNALQITSTMTGVAMKSMHRSSLSAIEIADFSKFLV